MAVTAPTGRTLALVLGTGPQDGATVAALRLAEEALHRGHRVAVYTYGDGVRVGARGAVTAGHVEALLRRGVHGGLTSWVADRSSTERGPAIEPVEGVMSGDGGDLWRFVGGADVALGVTR